MKILITGGHHSSALPVLDELKSRESKIELIWVGHKFSLKEDRNESLEYREITALGIPFFELKTPKFYKNVTIGTFIKFFQGIISAFKLLQKQEPDIVLSFGGYLAVPVVLCAWLKRIPIITHEQTVTTGYANKVISIFARKVLVSWEQSLEHFPGKKTVVVGIPLRKAILKSTSRDFFINSKLPTIYVTGGKSGSHIINMVVKNCLTNLLSFCNVIHQCGDYSGYNDFEDLNSYYSQFKNRYQGRYFLRKFIYEDNIGEVYSKSVLIISRSGAHTIAELAFLNKPCILIPISWVSHNEQLKNAWILEEQGLAKILPEDQLDEEKLVTLIKEMLNNINLYKLKNPKLVRVSKNSAKLIVDEIFKTASFK